MFFLITDNPFGLRAAAVAAAAAMLLLLSAMTEG